MTENFNHPESDQDIITSRTDLELQNIDELRQAIAHADRDQILALLEGEHHADIADKFEQLAAEERADTVDLAPEILSPAVLAELEDEVLEDILPLLPAERISDAVQELDSDDAIQLVEELDDTRRAEVLAVLPDRDREDLEAGFAFDEETAGRLMQREFVAGHEF